MTSSRVEPPPVATKYELVHSVGSRDRSVPNSWRRSHLNDLNSFDKPVDSILRVADHREVDAVGHGLQREDRGILAGAHLPDDLFEAGVDVAGQDQAPALRAPHDVERAAVGDAVL